jgi:hypothetical protein
MAIKDIKTVLKYPGSRRMAGGYADTYQLLERLDIGESREIECTDKAAANSFRVAFTSYTKRHNLQYDIRLMQNSVFVKRLA